MAITAGPLPILSTIQNPISWARRGEMQSSAWSEPIQLTPRFTALKVNLAAGKEPALTASWQRLMRELPGEINAISTLGSQAIPTLGFQNLAEPQAAERFLQQLRERGVGIIRNVVPKETALSWSRGAAEHTRQETAAASSLHSGPQDVYWSAAQVQARAHPNLLAAQRFVMSIWQSKTPGARVVTGFPVTYADRMRAAKDGEARGTASAHVDGGSVERWEPDGYGRAGTYKDVLEGRWEEYDPWESSTRLGVTSDLYHKAGACSIFRMFQGWLALDTIQSGQGSVQVCPLPRHATAYFLLRPFFSPSPPAATTATPTAPPKAGAEEPEWVFNRPQNSILHGALPSYAQEITPTLHPHLQLERSLVPVPQLEPGDYLVWHPDLIHAVSSDTASPTNTSDTPTYTSMYLPACPLTQTNALYLARQRKAFLQNHPPPDFFVGGTRSRRGTGGDGSEQNNDDDGAGQRPGVREVGDAGGDDGLRAMGLLPWDEEEADTDAEREVLAMANGILFPDLFDML